MSKRISIYVPGTRLANEEIKRGLGRKGNGGGGHGKGPHSDTCKANMRLRKLLAKVPVGRPGNIVWTGMQYPGICEAWFRPSQDAMQINL